MANNLPTGSVDIAGTATQGEVLLASNSLVDADGLGTVSYQWERADGQGGWSSVSGATGTSYTLSQADVGQAVRVVASYTDQQGTLESVTSTPTGSVANVNDLPTGSVDIAGTATQGEVLLASNSLADADGLGTVSYQWERADGQGGWSSVSGATGTSYTLSQADVGQAVRVVASYTDQQGTLESVTSTPTGSVANVNDLPTGSVDIAGTATQGEVLLASNSLVDADGLGTVSYQWERADGQGGWSSVSGATGTSYTLSQADVGQAVRVVASYTDQQGTLESVTSTPTGSVANVNDLPTGSVDIAGTATQGEVLLASNSLADADGLGTVSYQWERADGQGGWSSVSGATGTSYTLSQADVGQAVRVVASYTDQQGTLESVTSTPTGSVANVNDLPTGSVDIAGTATQGEVLLASNSLADADGLGTVSYQWERADGQGGWSSVSGATGTSYTLSQADVGQAVRVVASYTDQQGTLESVTSTPTGSVANVNDLPTGSVDIAGTATQGEVLLASNSLVDADGLGTVSYQWERADGQGGWSSVSGATGTSYTLSQADVGQAVRVVASYTDQQGTLESVTSTPTGSVANVNDLPTGSVDIAGTATQGEVLLASNSLADADGLGTVSYQWERADGQGGWSSVSGATGTSYTLSQADVGQAVRVVASYTDQQGTLESVTSTPTGSVANVNDLPTGSVDIAGTATQGEVLLASNSLVDADGLGTVSYQWERADGQGGWSSVSGATGTSYTLSQADVGQAVRVVASYTDQQGTLESVTSTPTGSVANVNDLPTGSVDIAGTATQGEVLLASNSLADADGLGTVSYQWERADGQGGWSSVSGATGTSYTLSQADVGQAVRVVASYTDQQGTLESVTSTPTGSVANVNDLPTGSVDIAGTATQGEVLLASNSLADADGLGTVSYQWERADGQGGWSSVSGATGTSYTLSQADVGQAVRVVASYTDQQGTLESVTSTPTGSVANVNDLPTGSVDIAGTATQGEVLLASNSLADADGLGTVSYQWERADGQGGWSSVSGATGTSYTLSQADVGQAVRVVASYTDQQGTLESVTSTPTGSVANVNDLPTGSVDIAGTATQGEVLLASNSLADADGLGTVSYQWERADGQGGWSSVSGATGTSYTLSQADVGQAVRVVASYTDQQGTLESVTSTPTGSVANVNDLPTGSVDIAGTATQGEVLLASNSLADADGLGTVSYQWERADGQGGWSSVSGATGTSYTLSQADVGQAVRVVASYTDQQGTLESVTSTPTGSVANVNDLPTGSVDIAGTATQGEVLLASNSLADADGLGTVSYQWERADGQGGWSSVSGATGTSYTLSQADVGQAVRVVASYTDQQGTLESVTSTPTGSVANVNDLPTGSVDIAGTATQGEVLLASNSLVDADGLGTVSYQWERADGQGGWSSVSGATGTSYTLSQADVGQAVRVVASYTDQQGTLESVTSTPTGSVANVNDLPTGSVDIAGTATQGEVLLASNSLVDADGLGTVSYQWERADGQGGWSSVSGATGTSYTLSQADVGQAVRVVASYTDQQGTLESVTSTPTGSVANVNDLPTGSVDIAGTATQGEVLLASNSLADADGLGTVSYQWERADGQGGWSSVSGATGTSYTLSQADVGQAVRVVASYTDQQGTLESVTSTPTGSVANVNDLPTGSVDIAGTATQGEVLLASNSLVDADGLGTVSYQWERADGQGGWSSVSGATGTSYTLSQADVGQAVRVVASYTDQQGTLESVTSTPTGSVANVNDLPTGNGSHNTVIVHSDATAITNTNGSIVMVRTTGTVLSYGPDTIFGGSGATNVTTNGTGAIVIGAAGALSVIGAAGTSTIYAGTGGLTYTGGSAFDTVIGGGNAATINGGAGGGLFFGGGQAVITAGAGGNLNVEVGGNGDQLYAVGPKGVLFGTSGGDVLMSSKADAGNSVFFGANGSGQMTFITGAGDDLLALGQGTNTVTLGSGHNVIFGNGGTTSSTTITAGTGSLDLAFSGADTALTIAAGPARAFNLYAYTPGNDTIHLEGYQASQVNTALATQVHIGGGTQLTLDDGSVISLINVSHVDARLFT